MTVITTPEGAPLLRSWQGRAFLPIGSRSSLQHCRWPLVQAYASGLVVCIIAKAAPRPLSGFQHQSASHWILMHVPQFLYAFHPAPHVEIIEPRLPNVPRLVIIPELLLSVRPASV